MHTWIVGKDLMKHHCLIKKLFIVAENIADIDYRHSNKVFKKA